MLGLRHGDMAKSANAPCVWKSSSGAAHARHHTQTGTSDEEESAMADAAAFKAQYEREVQRIFSRVQHHWHDTDKDGRDVPMKYSVTNAK